jgi:hypothetical protein
VMRHSDPALNEDNKFRPSEEEVFHKLQRDHSHHRKELDHILPTQAH